MPVISLINMKGGVGKTTLTFNLAYYVAYHWHLRVLLIDLDPQANLSQYSMGADKYLDYIEAEKGTIFDVFEQFSSSKAKDIEPDDVIYSLRNFYQNGVIDLVPSKLELAWTLKNPTEKAHLLYQLLEKADEMNSYDLVLIDCAPTESILTTSAYIASDLIFVPVKPEFLATIGLPLLARSIDEFHRKYPKSKMEMGGIIFNGTARTNRPPEQIKAIHDVTKIANKYDWSIFENHAYFSNSYAKGSRDSSSILFTDNARYSVREEFCDLGNEFMCTISYFLEDETSIGRNFLSKVFGKKDNT
ncbi:MAG: ParA family protein [Lyngbya sp.]|nr:ParA family protein [Lyngbya sp.]